MQKLSRRVENLLEGERFPDSSQIVPTSSFKTLFSLFLTGKGFLMRNSFTCISEPKDDESRLRPIARSFELLTGNRPSPPTIWRWKKRGCKGVSLPFIQVGGVAMISVRDAKNWLQAVTEASRGATRRSAKSSSARAQRAAQQLSDLIRS
jgi:hypothetical protein